MVLSSNRHLTTVNAGLIYLEALTVSVVVLAIITLVAGRYPHSLQHSPILTFDTSSIRNLLSNQGISNPGKVQDWYEPHYLSVCKGMWQSASTHVKNEASRVCTMMGGGYTFSLPELLAADAGLPLDSPLLSNWSFAVLNTMMPFVCLVIGIACASLTMIAYFITIITTPLLTTKSPLLVPRVGFLASVAALITLIISSTKITVMIHKLLGTKFVVENGVAFSSSGFYVFTWLATALMCVMFVLSMVLAFMLQPPTTSRKGGI